jgi:hypothetical protein|tara:strand:- start:187 stop:1521 length:1335 start_codon:yes stop_codon:yes gene_type:complete
MASTYSTSLRIELQTTGENSGTWGTITNNNFSQSLEFAIAGVVNVACGDAAVTTLTNADGPQTQANNQARNAHIRLTGAHGAVRIAQFPATQKVYLITNATTDSGSSGPYAMTCRLGSSGNTISIANGTTRLVSTDGTNWYDVFSLAGSIDLQGQELILDADADTSITADTDDQIDFKIGNTDVANFKNSSSDFVITSAVQDKDIVFKGDDGGSGITALTLDMSDAGAATFNAGVTATTGTFSGVVDADAGVTIDNITIDGTEIDLSSGDLTLDVAGDIVLDAGGNDLIFQSGGTAIGHITNSSSDLVIESKVSDKDMIFKGNDGGSGVTALTLDMSGAGAATFNNDVTAFSDKRLKTDIKNIDDALSKVMKMQGVYYKRNDIQDAKEQVGVLAQDMEEILPQVVITADDDIKTKSVDYGKLTSVLIESIKQLKTEIDELKNRS